MYSHAYLFTAVAFFCNTWTYFAWSHEWHNICLLSGPLIYHRIQCQFESFSESNRNKPAKYEKICYTLHVHVWKDKTVSTVTIGMYIYHGHESIYITRYMAYSGFIKYESGNGWRSILLDPIDPSFMQLFWEVFSKHDASERIWISLFAGKYAGAHWENILRQS